MAVSKRKCKQCGEYREAAAGVKVPSGWFCSNDHAVAFAMDSAKKKRDRAIAKQRRDVVMKEKEQRKEHKQRVSDVKPISYWMKRAQAAFNAWIRERDSGKPCVSCGHPDDGSRQRHASHYRSVGACSFLRFNELNVNASCSICNNWLSGNIGNYRVELINRIGIERVEWLECQPKTKRFDIETAKSIEKQYKEMLNKMR